MKVLVMKYLVSFTCSCLTSPPIICDSAKRFSAKVHLPTKAIYPQLNCFQLFDTFVMK
jgi:hypothetical protein